MSDAPIQPEHTFIIPDDAESTQIAIDGVLCLLQQYSITIADAPLVDREHCHGLYHVLEGVRSAVKAMSRMEIRNVTRLEVRS